MANWTFGQAAVQALGRSHRRLRLLNPLRVLGRVVLIHVSLGQSGLRLSLTRIL